MHNATKNTPDPATNPNASTHGLYEGIFSILLGRRGTLSAHAARCVAVVAGHESHPSVVEVLGVCTFGFPRSTHLAARARVERGAEAIAGLGRGRRGDPRLGEEAV